MKDSPTIRNEISLGFQGKSKGALFGKGNGPYIDDSEEDRSWRDFNLLACPPPTGWYNCKFGDVCDRVQDSYKPVEGGTTPYVGLEHLAQGFPALIGRGTESDIKSSKTAFKNGDVLFGKLRPYLRKGVQMEFDGISSTDILVFRVKEKCERDFLKYLVHSDAFIGYAKSTTTGVQHPRTSWSSLKEFCLSLPPHSEQKKIAHVLSVIQRAIEAQERIIQTITELKYALVHKLFTEGLRNEHQKQTEIGVVPESWEIRKLGEIAQKISKGSSPKWQGFQYTDSGILFVRSQNVGSGRLLLEERVYLPAEFNEKEKRSVLRSSDILINLVGASIGRVSLGTDDIDGGNCNQAVGFVRLDCSKYVKQLVVYFLLSPRGQEQMRKQKKDIARANLSLRDLRGFTIPIPSTKEEAEEVANIFVSLENKIDNHERKRSQFQDLFRALLHKLLTATIRVDEIKLTAI